MWPEPYIRAGHQVQHEAHIYRVSLWEICKGHGHGGCAPAGEVRSRPVGVMKMVKQLQT